MDFDRHCTTQFVPSTRDQFFGRRRTHRDIEADAPAENGDPDGERACAEI